MKRYLFLITISIFLSLPLFSQAQDILGGELIFNIESSYDLTQRTELAATLIKLSPTAYWYADSAWWNGFTAQEQEEVSQSLTSLATEFEENIYPVLTRTFGSEWTPGIDKDTRITILVHPMKKVTGGYTDTSDEYLKVQIPESNEREMIYLNSQYINTDYIKSFLAHEFVHLITFNQKNKSYNISEDIWLNEARAEYAPTLLGYDGNYEGSNMERRVKDFLNKPSDSLTEWREAPADYGVANLFIQYLVDHYGVRILADSLKLRQTGIQSLNTVLSQMGFKEDFPQIFTNWTMAALVNDCSISEKHCYYNQNLKKLRITPLMNYLPLVGVSTLSVTNATKDWAGNWHKFVGGQGTLTVQFRGNDQANFQVPYVIQDVDGNLSPGYLTLDEKGEGKILIENFGAENISLTILPIAQRKTAGFSSNEPDRTFFWLVSTEEEEKINIPSLPPLTKPLFQMSRVELLARIAEIQSLVRQLQVMLQEISGTTASCSSITQDLYFGLSDNEQVRCLQEFLKSQGPTIYPESIVNGNFYTLTQTAVIRFQEKYAQDVLVPLGLQKGTGYVGASTRAKINQLLTE
ncbi:MAG: hypothetical protein COT59_01275 [Candidatus Nealsonbacteria bacterium CG09_land_8_20_14_0_10_42_14]|uniref:Peptidoglycan binding-like domain-containing protein n=1 Tax=Candidatus Nealsonbacteria bacterium CG09_land_8_20_14_0_10_42_14 TaxID=1974707 RepID=A0A2H0WXH5_9BACT|nr:MAG: hypothetical protein COT59_01275 [Candidatus Nealsonbacteria bacterium CG09_land_8_20_14_0_10_42_14]